MKLKNIMKNTLLFVMVIGIIIVSVFAVSAEPDTEVPVAETSATIAETEVTTAPPTQAETTPPQTTASTTPPQEETEIETQAPEDESQQATSVEDEPESTKTTYATTQSTTASLPDAPVNTAPTAVVVAPEREVGDLTYGIASWACVIIGVAVVVIVLISNKTQTHGGSGKQRYDEGNRITGQKRLLNDDYYNQRKSKSYFNKDTRR